MIVANLWLFLLAFVGSQDSYYQQFPPNGTYYAKCDSQGTSLCRDVCVACEGGKTKPELEDCLLGASSTLQVNCVLNVDWEFDHIQAPSWSRFLPNTTFDLTSVLLDSRWISKLDSLILNIELTTDVNTLEMNDDFYSIPGNDVPTNTPSPDATPSELIFDAYLMKEAPQGPVDFALCSNVEFSRSVQNITSSALQYIEVSTPAPMPTPYPYSIVPRLVHFTLNVTDLVQGADMPTTGKFYCLNLSWSQTALVFRSSVVVTNVTFSGNATESFQIW
eukprot:Gregarina_sp_Poly_1__897@NODE_1214_length_4765_cov_82_919327_g828_i0_p4_GENE_NODE_1214_length_4765_cov_82_919327_g828_i0NODE_1214_length_4765_cov_82_919327_g828_i0_p4_ORF_typecomplete_len276_score22_80_NODE_1214_length_4765_cov_82_919327_g828_i016262453